MPTATATTTPSPGSRAAAKRPKPTCDDCYFGRNLLCALDLREACPTHRPYADRLKPPRQLSFVFRQERTRAAWVFERDV